MALKVTITADRLEEIQGRIGGIDKLDYSPVSAVLAEQAVNWGTRAFKDTSMRPKPWAPWSDSYKAKLYGAWKKENTTKRGKLRKSAQFDRRLLIDTGGLKDSLSATTSGGHAYISSDREYAAYHQFGAPNANLPARPFLPIEVDFATGSATLTQAAWEAIRPALEQRVKLLILGS